MDLYRIRLTTPQAIHLTSALYLEGLLPLLARGPSTKGGPESLPSIKASMPHLVVVYRPLLSALRSVCWATFPDGPSSEVDPLQLITYIPS